MFAGVLDASQIYLSGVFIVNLVHIAYWFRLSQMFLFYTPWKRQETKGGVKKWNIG